MTKNGLNEIVFSSEKNLDSLFKSLEKKSQKTIEESTLSYEIGDNKDKNTIYAEMTRTPEIEAQSIAFITNLMNTILENSKNPKIGELLDLLSEEIT